MEIGKSSVLKGKRFYWFLLDPIFKKDIFGALQINYSNNVLLRKALDKDRNSKINSVTPWFYSNMNDIVNNTSYIVKIKKSVSDEVWIYKVIDTFISNKTGFLEMIDYNVKIDDKELSMIVLEKKGINLFKGFKEIGSVEYGFFLFNKILEPLQKLHSLGYMHGDIKPDNILVYNTNQIFLIDFDFSLMFKDKESDSFKLKKTVGCYGTPLFASLNAHSGLSNLPINDIESLVYSFMFILNIDQFKTMTEKMKLNELKELKKDIKAKINYLPFYSLNPFYKILKYCYNQFDKEVNFELVRSYIITSYES